MKETTQQKAFALEIKDMNDEAGTFTGMLSVYGVEDLVGDIVEPGAFTKTLKESGGIIPLLWQHKTDEPLGELQVTEAANGIEVKGTLDMNVQRAREAHSLIKSKFLKGLSMGYMTVKKEMKKGIRHLKEVKLMEGSLVTFPALPAAQIQSVKAALASKDFNEDMQGAMAMAAPGIAINALCCCLYENLWMSGEDPQGAVDSSSEAIDQFKTAYIDMLPAALAAMAAEYGEDLGMMSRKPPSEHSRLFIERIIKSLEALLTAGTSLEAAAAGEAATEAANEWLADFDRTLQSV